MFGFHVCQWGKQAETPAARGEFSQKEEADRESREVKDGGGEEENQMEREWEVDCKENGEWRKVKK